MKTITLSERNGIMERENALGQWMRARKVNSYKPEDVAHLNPPTNEERSAVELFDFMKEQPSRVFAYRTTSNRAIHNWMGETLASVTWEGSEYRDNMGGKRYAFRAIGVNGIAYAGVAFPSAGDYVRMRAVKIK